MSRRGLFICMIGIGLLLGALVTRSGTLALLSLPFIAYVAVGLREAPPSRLQLSAERSVDSVRTAATALVHVTVRVRNEGASVGALRLSDALPGGVGLRTGSASKCGSLRPGQTMNLEYVFHALTGVIHWDAVHVVAADQFRLFKKAVDLPAEGGIVILPRVRRFRPFALSPERTLHSPGSILGGRAGSGTDFWGIREYRPGDEMRRLDWGRAARHPGQLFTCENEQEEIADVGLVLDARSEINLRSGTRDLARISVDAAASLAEMFLRGGNRVGLALLQATIGIVPPGYGKVQLYRILRALAGVHADAESSRCTLDRVPLRVFSTRALIVVISPLTGKERELFPRLRARGNEGLLVSPDPVDFMKHDARDAVSRLASRLARVERRLDLQRVAELGIRVIDWKVGASLAPLVRRALQRSRGCAGGVGR